ncbi:MAG: DUF4286 family protein [Bacteroidota bacterium]
MILYNITVNIHSDFEEEWLQWMKGKHIPKVLATGYFLEHKIFKLLNETPDNDGATYSIQYFVESMEELNEYQIKEAPQLQKEHAERFKDKFVAFRTFLESV